MSSLDDAKLIREIGDGPIADALAQQQQDLELEHRALCKCCGGGMPRPRQLTAPASQQSSESAMRTAGAAACSLRCSADMAPSQFHGEGLLPSCDDAGTGVERRFRFCVWLLGALLAGLGCRGDAGGSSSTSRGSALAALAPGARMQPAAPGRAAAPAERRDDAALACFERARDQLRLSDGNAFLLCRGAHSTAPAECYAQGDDRTFLSSAQLFDLCRCASSAASIDCYERAQRETFLPERKLIALCSPVVTLDLLPSCAPIYTGRAR